METRQIRSKISLWIFSVVMILFYYMGLAYPKQTDFWLVRYGFLILFFEFLSLFVIVLVLMMAGEEDITLKPFKWIHTNWIPIFFLGLIIFMAFAASSIFNFLVFPYFLLSIAIKYFAFKKINTVKGTDEKMIGVLRGVLASMLSLCPALFLPIPFLSTVRDTFSHQTDILAKFILENMPPSHGNISTGDIPVWIALAGIIYFISFPLFDSIISFYELKTGRSLRYMRWKNE